MGNIIQFKRPTQKEKHKGKTLCKSGFHKWEAVKGTPFDVKNGKLITRYRCSRCGTIQVKKR